MYKSYTAVLSCLVLTLLAACGGGDDAFTASPDPGPVAPALATLALLTSSPQLPSDGALPVNLTAQVKDASNNLVPDVTVSFAADSGSVSVSQPITDVNGQALAQLTTLGDPTNRTITVTATVDDGTNLLTDTITVSVVGTQLSISGPTSLALGASAEYTVELVDANGQGIAGQTVALSSSAGNTLSVTTLTTDAAGKGLFRLTASQGSDTLTAEALGLVASRAIAVSTDSFEFVTPVPQPDSPPAVALNATQTVTVRWTASGVPVPFTDVTFSTTRGTLSDNTAQTNANGEATVTIESANAGAATVTATGAGGPSAQLALEFIATDPDTIEVQASPFTLAPGEQSTITAVIRDPNNNLVARQNVIFQLDDVTGGVLSNGLVETDSQGRAQTVYTASSSTSAKDGVVITAIVENAPDVTDFTALTVARREVFITFGTGNEIFEDNPTQYRMPFAVQATDADGNAVEGVDIQLSLLSTRYLKGIWVADTLNDQWVCEVRTNCNDEDIDRDGVLDLVDGQAGTGEDRNGTGKIEAGNIGAVTPGATTDATGSALIDVVYPQVYGCWLEVTLQARTAVQGTEFTESQTFILPVSADDVDSLDESPPGVSVPPDPDPDNQLEEGGLVSPFGYSFADQDEDGFCENPI
jgi:hypothetical protein